MCGAESWWDKRSEWIKQWNWWGQWRHPRDPHSWCIMPGEHSKADTAWHTANSLKSRLQSERDFKLRDSDGENGKVRTCRQAAKDNHRASPLWKRGRCHAKPKHITVHMISSLFIYFRWRWTAEWFLISLTEGEQGKTEEINFPFRAGRVIYWRANPKEDLIRTGEICLFTIYAHGHTHTHAHILLHTEKRIYSKDGRDHSRGIFNPPDVN